jgi:hypothetical protein
LFLAPSGGDDTPNLLEAVKKTAGRDVIQLAGVYKLTTLDVRDIADGVLRGTATLARNVIGPSYNATTFQGLAGQPIILMPDRGSVAEPCGWEIGGIVFKGGTDQLSYGNGGLVAYLHDLTFEDASHAGVYGKGFIQDWVWERITFRGNDFPMPYGLLYNDEPGTNPTQKLFDKCSFRNVRAVNCGVNGVRLVSRHSKGVTWTDPVMEICGEDGWVLGGFIDHHVITNPTFEHNGATIKPYAPSPFSDLKFLTVDGVAGPEGNSPNHCTVIGGQMGGYSVRGSVQYGIDAAGYNPKGRLSLINPYMPGHGNNDPNGVIRTA